MSTNNVDINVKINTTGAIADVKKLDDQIKKTTNTASSANKSQGSMLSSLKGGYLAVAAAATAVIAVIGKMASASIAAYNIQTQAVLKLNNALAFTGQYTAKASSDLQKFASDLQSKTTYGDELLLQNMANLQAKTGVTQKELEGLTKTAVGLADTYGFDIKTAFELVAKAQNGNTGALKKYGIEISNINDLTSKQNELLESSMKIRDTEAGRLAALKNSVGDVQEGIGTAFATISDTIIKEFLPTIEKVSTWFVENGDLIKKIAKTIGVVITTLVKLTVAQFKQLMAPFNIFLDILFDSFDIFSNLSNLIKDSIPIIAQMLKSIVTLDYKGAEEAGRKLGVAITNNMSESLQNARNNIKKNIKDLTMQGVSYGDSFNQIKDVWTTDEKPAEFTNVEKKIEGDKEVSDERKKIAEETAKALLKSEEDLQKALLDERKRSAKENKKLLLEINIEELNNNELKEINLAKSLEEQNNIRLRYDIERRKLVDEYNDWEKEEEKKKLEDIKKIYEQASNEFNNLVKANSFDTLFDTPKENIKDFKSKFGTGNFQDDYIKAQTMVIQGPEKIGSENWELANKYIEDVNENLGDMKSIFDSLGGILESFFSNILDFSNGISNFTDTLKNAFNELGKSIIKMIGQIVAKILATKVLTMLSSIFTGGGSSLIKTITASFAHGGLVPPTPVYAANGYYVGGDTRGRDSVPAMLTPGEFVLSKRGVDNIGLENLERYNDGKLSNSGGNINVNIQYALGNTDAIADLYKRGIAKAERQSKFLRKE